VPSSRPLLRFRDIVDNIEAIELYADGRDVARFQADWKTRDACERCLMRISEAAAKLGAEAESLRPDFPWADVRGLGNHLRHAYDRVDPQILWEVISGDLPRLKAVCRAAIASLEDRPK
tara:strand:+ start:6306 stop:6662 length:357 start_codon:yes stop_codon:yes gene_type:complete